MPIPTILTNATLILEEETLNGTLVFDSKGIISIDQGRSKLSEAIDCKEDLVAPGIVEMHTDNLEKHLMPRPRVRWPNPLAAALVHDAQMAAAGVTTVFDAVCAGGHENGNDERKAIFADEIASIGMGREQDLFRIDHYLHLRCELSDPDLVALVEPQRGKDYLKLVSLMDHTPGQRQWRDAAHLRTYLTGTGLTAAQIEHEIHGRREIGTTSSSKNWPLLVDMFANSGIVMASHDDTEEDHVEMAIEAGCHISEFPTTVLAAKAAKHRGLATIGGAPNIVRGGSHSGGVSMRELVKLDLLDGLSSDYVPSSLLQAVQILNAEGLSLPKAFGMVTWKVADMVGLADRARLKPGLRSDIIRIKMIGPTPIVRRVWSAGQIAF